MDNLLVLKHGFKIVSGGQTGVDLAGLRYGQVFGFLTGGLAPRGWKTTAGPKPELKKLFQLEESTGGYSVRTYANVFHSDFTLLLAQKPDSHGTALTLTCAKELKKPHFAIQIPFSQNGSYSFDNRTLDQAAHMILSQLKDKDQFILNIAGNSSKTAPGIFIPAFYVLMEIMTRVMQNVQSDEFPDIKADFQMRENQIRSNMQLIQGLNDNFTLIPELDSRRMRGLVL